MRKRIDGVNGGMAVSRLEDMVYYIYYINVRSVTWSVPVNSLIVEYGRSKQIRKKFKLTDSR